MYVLLTAAPGTGKSTVIQRLAALLPDIRLAGFYTAEIRERGERRGFRLVAYDGSETLIAHVELPKTHRVGKYGVDVAAMERAADATLGPRRGVQLYLVDEIGKMECLSERFTAHLRRILDGRVPLVATVNRDAMPGQLLARLEQRQN